MAKHHYMTQPDQYGEINPITAEYTTMSLKPGIGRDWYDQYKEDLFPDNYCVIDGRKLPVPNYYKKLYEKDNPDDYREILEKQKKHHHLTKENKTPERLYVRAQVAALNLRRLKRELP